MNPKGDFFQRSKDLEVSIESLRQRDITLSNQMIMEKGYPESGRTFMAQNVINSGETRRSKNTTSIRDEVLLTVLDTEQSGLLDKIIQSHRNMADEVSVI